MIGLNEVGGSPGRDGISIEEFHRYCEHMQATFPRTMTALSTHDTKRGEDVRARLAALTEIPGRWKSALSRWSRMNAAFKTRNFPDRNTEYFLYQTLIGAWPISSERLLAYMEKAVREAKQQTSWTSQNKEFEDALRNFIEQILASRDFTADLEAVVGNILQAGRINGLAQTLMKFTAPGVPDTYQGSELWDLRLVDPDNRTPVDYGQRQSMLNELKKGMTAEEILRREDSAMPKLWVTHCALALRAGHPEWFGAQAEYRPLYATGPRAENVVGYLRGAYVATVVPRWPQKTSDNWSATSIELPTGRWRNTFTGDGVTGGRVRVQQILRRFPVALLTKESD
jgi:(1->4)-alpha-D-glucan 1-alpha-D-glucosylmutase